MLNSFESLIQEYNELRDPIERTSLCHAPSVNLNFEQSGNATACCYNRRFILGRYPKNSLKEIWEGPRIQLMRDLLAKNDLSQGCQLCKHQLESRNFAGSRMSAFDKLMHHPAAKPLEAGRLMPRVMEFETSNICNLECVMCNGYFSSSIRRNRERLEPMKNPYDDAFVEQLRPFLPYLTDAKFLGGEPFLNPLYYKIWNLIREVNPAINICVTTNATIMNRKVQEFMRDLRPVISISVDSLDKDVYEAIRVNASFETFSANLETYVRYANVVGKALGIAVCPMTQNWQGLSKIFEFCNRNKACIGFNTVIWPPDLSIKNLPKAEIQNIHRELKKECAPELKTHEDWWVRYNYGSYQSMLNQIESWSVEEETVQEAVPETSVAHA